MHRKFWGRLLTYSEIERESEDQVDLQPFVRFPAIDEGVCQRCNNDTDFAYLPAQKVFGFPKERKYCLRCLQMGRILEGEELYYCPSQEKEAQKAYHLAWEGTLSKQQEQVSQALVDCQASIHLVHAVTGAGKTEMIFNVILKVLRRGGRVALASPRIDVCLELKPRLQAAFPSVDLIFLYGESEEAYRYTPLVISTSHQLLRFKEAFDLLIVDEIDAFPFANSPELHFAVERAVKKAGKIIYLTATPSKGLLKQAEGGKLALSVLPARFHRHPLVVPKYIWLSSWRQAIKKRNKSSVFWSSLQRFVKLQGVLLIFMPTIELTEKLHAWMKVEGLSGWEAVHSVDPERKEKVQALREGHLKGLLSTTILERGVTFTNCQVMIVGAEDRVFTSSSLIQMSGRVGRKKEFPGGHVWFGHYGITRDMDEAVRQIKALNKQAAKEGLLHE